MVHALDDDECSFIPFGAKIIMQMSDGLACMSVHGAVGRAVGRAVNAQSV